MTLEQGKPDCDHDYVPGDPKLKQPHCWKCGKELETCKSCHLALKEERGIEEWCACEVGIDINEDGEPLGECHEHGIYSGEGSCPGCDRIDRDIDEAIERDHAKGGKIQW